MAEEKIEPVIPPQLEEIEQKFPAWYLGGVKLVLLTLLMIMFLSMVWGVWETVEQAIIHARNGLLSMLKSLLVNTLLLLALLEVSRTILTYFTLGRVKVTYIVDSVLAVLLSETLVTWFSNEPLSRYIELVMVLLALTILRVYAIQYHPAPVGAKEKRPFLDPSFPRVWRKMGWVSRGKSPPPRR
ncbi:MAG: phosphate-starvation-inducible PsiE family protein [Nitrospirae bacterium]|nr:phosphate-starvation-inducible PsiE family protein [Nitrospirota bacterium]